MKRSLSLILAVILLIACFGCYWWRDRRGYDDRGGYGDRDRGEYGDRDRGERGDRDRDEHEERH